MYFSKKTVTNRKEVIIKELAKLESMNWAADNEVAESVFPYVLIEAINILKNSTIVDSPYDYAKTGKQAKAMLTQILSTNKE
jgi:hypothetical protein